MTQLGGELSANRGNRGFFLLLYMLTTPVKVCTHHGAAKPNFLSVLVCSDCFHHSMCSRHPERDRPTVWKVNFNTFFFLSEHG